MSESETEDEEAKMNVRSKVEKLVKDKFAGILSDVRVRTSSVAQWIESTRRVHEPGNATIEQNSNNIVLDDSHLLYSDEEDVVLNPIYDDDNIPLESFPRSEEVAVDQNESLASKILTKLNLPEKDRKLKLPKVPKVPNVGAISELCGKLVETQKVKMDLKKLLQQKGLKRQEGLCVESVEKKEEQVVIQPNADEEDESRDEFPDINENQRDESAIQFLFDESLPKSALASNSSFSDISSDAVNYSDAFTASHINISTSSTQEHLVRQQRHRLCMGEIGRSISDNPNNCTTGGTTGGSVGNTKKFALTDIGRSFSVAAGDDEVAAIFVVAEGNNSCPIPSSLHASANISTLNSSNNNLVFAANSVPVSPLGRHQRVDTHLPLSEGNNYKNKKLLLRDSSFQSDSSHCSSVESLLEARKPDPEAILINLGFGPPRTEDVLSKIPKRFLKPSQVRGIDTEEFLKKQQMAKHLHENSVLGYRGLIGNPDIAPSSIVAKIMERFQLNDQNNRLSCDLINNNRPRSAPPTQTSFSNFHQFSNQLATQFKK